MLIIDENKSVTIETNTEDLYSKTEIVSIDGEKAVDFRIYLILNKPPVSDGKLFSHSYYTNQDLQIALSLFNPID